MIQLTNLSESEIKTQSAMGEVVIPAGGSIEVTEAEAMELQRRYGFLQASEVKSEEPQIQLGLGSSENSILRHPKIQEKMQGFAEELVEKGFPESEEKKLAAKRKAVKRVVAEKKPAPKKKAGRPKKK